MRADVRLAGAAVLAILALSATGCGSRQAVRIGVLSDCRGASGAFNESALAGAEFPLIQHGARLRGVKPSQGITGARVAGRDVTFFTGCTESGTFDLLVAEARRLVELEHVDVIVGGYGNEDSLVLEEVARKYPDIPFVLAANTLREATVRDPAPNVYRFEPDDAQQVAGLGTYAYRDLGWRKATVVADDFSWGWAQAEAFAAEFCALGGHVDSQVNVSPYEPSTSDPRRVPIGAVDGVAAFVTPFAGSSSLVRGLAKRVGDPARRLVLGPWITLDPTFRADIGRSVVGVVAGGEWHPPGSTPELRAQERAFSNAFPRGSAVSLADALTHSYELAVTAVLDALQAAHGDLSDGRRDLREQLSHVVLGGPDPVRLDRNRQAIVGTPLTRLIDLPRGGGVGLRVVRTIHAVDETIGGVLPRTPESALPATCRTAEPPPWAR